MNHDIARDVLMGPRYTSEGQRVEITQHVDHVTMRVRANDSGAFVPVPAIALHLAPDEAMHIVRGLLAGVIALEPDDWSVQVGAYLLREPEGDDE